MRPLDVIRPPVPPRAVFARGDGITSDWRIETARRRGVVRKLLPAAAAAELATVDGGSGCPLLAGQRLSRDRARSFVADAAACCCCNAVRLADAVRARDRATAFISSLRNAAAAAEDWDGDGGTQPPPATDDDDGGGSIRATRLRTSDDLR